MTLFWKLASLAALIMVLGLALTMVVTPALEAVLHAYLRHRARRELKAHTAPELVAVIDRRIAALQAHAPQPNTAGSDSPGRAPEDPPRLAFKVRWLQRYRRAVLDVSE